MHVVNLNDGSALALALLVAAIVATSAYGRRRRLALGRFLGAALASRLTRAASAPRRRLRAILLTLGLGALALAALRPIGHERPDARAPSSRHVLILLDCSRSMLARDAAPTRLAQAKRWIAEFLAARPTDRYALAAFAGDAVLLCPFTADRNTVLHVAHDVEAGAVGHGGTNIEAAMLRARAILADNEHRQGRLVILITDGEAVQGQAEAALPFFVAAEIPIFATGIGDPTAVSSIALDDGTVLQDASGERVETRQDAALLLRLAVATGGRYVHGADGTDSVELMASAIGALPVSVTASAPVSGVLRRAEYYQAPLLAAVLFLLSAMGLGHWRQDGAPRPRGQAVGAAFAVAFGTLSLASASMVFADSGAPPIRPGAASALALASDADADADAARRQFNAGCALAAAGRVEDALARFHAVAHTPHASPAIRGRAFLNSGALHHRRVQALLASDPAAALVLTERVEGLYRQAMALLPGLRQAPTNQTLLLRDRTVAEALLAAPETGPADAGAEDPQAAVPPDGAPLTATPAPGTPATQPPPNAGLDANAGGTAATAAQALSPGSDRDTHRELSAADVDLLLDRMRTGEASFERILLERERRHARVETPARDW